MIREIYFEYVLSDLVRTQYLEFYVLAARERAHKSEQQQRTTNSTRTIRTTTTAAKPVDGANHQRESSELDHHHHHRRTPTRPPPASDLNPRGEYLVWLWMHHVCIPHRKGGSLSGSGSIPVHRQRQTDSQAQAIAIDRPGSALCYLTESGKSYLCSVFAIKFGT